MSDGVHEPLLMINVYVYAQGVGGGTLPCPGHNTTPLAHWFVGATGSYRNIL